MRTVLLLPVLYVLARARWVGVVLVAAGLGGLAGTAGGLPVVSGLVVVLIAALGVMAVGLALALPSLSGGVTTPRRHDTTTSD